MIPSPRVNCGTPSTWAEPPPVTGGNRWPSIIPLKEKKRKMKLSLLNLNITEVIQINTQHIEISEKS